ncbi:GNAT family N-acetyltransferase [Saccharospirillum salsuginis]|uniref:N-acetyltransferase domain-containing protein n=1 Tax=Saccharospirillum salsuginis TaxID=418750 RepID=A0A918NDP0_9GAMM|nr:GNAT family N-acetyltransferase [Saccharospirillum salsuginis]GGX62704.1 hypothetical protein GCM10007392_33260 [Saccharospirillum salsuginis]
MNEQETHAPIVEDAQLGLELRPARPEDLAELVALSIEAFQDDTRFKPPGAYMGGPVGHDRLDYHKEWLSCYRYYACEHQGKIVGSAMVDVAGSLARIHGIHVSTASMGQGVGSWMLCALETALPKVTQWTLETPDYAIRNHRFYEKNGYTLEKITQPEPKLGFGFYIYEKQMPVT